ncbi:hypothetical protein B0H12DRAFT_1102828 [Mycena haematopus]|nr:hypothetical protein B0H12DRAFT_1102828 [Mycena haematopus]
MQAPRHAIFSGYSISSEYFMKVAWTLRPPFAAHPRQAPPGFIEYVCEYDSWRRALPTADRAKAPLLKVLRTDANNLNNHGDETDTKIFFTTRWVPAEDSDDDTPREDSALKQHETETDRTQRDELIALIKQTSGFSVDKSRLQFESVKDVHPLRDPLRTVRLVALFPRCSLCVLCPRSNDISIFPVALCSYMSDHPV